MAKYKRLFIYTRNSDSTQVEKVGNTVTVMYNISALVSKQITLLYNILTVDARSLWEKKEPAQALWEKPNPANPTYRPPTAAAGATNGLLLENGSSLLLENGDLLLLD